MTSSPSSFTNPKDLKFVFTLAIGLPNRFSAGGQQYLTLSVQGLRASVNIENAGGNTMPHLYAQIYGMTASDMNSVTTIQWGPQGSLAAGSNPALHNVVAVYAIDGAQETLVFSGSIMQAWGIYAGMPEVCLNIEAQGWYFAQITPARRTTIAANTDIVTVMEQLANNLGAIFEDNGVTGTVRAGQTFGGSYVDQAKAMAQAYQNQFTMWTDVTSASITTVGTLAITPPYTPRNGNAPLISRETGLMNYPIFNGYGVLFDTLFNPAIKFGGAVQIQSKIPKATGIWQVASMSHTLESQMPGGQWKSTVNTWNTPGLIAPPAGG